MSIRPAFPDWASLNTSMVGAIGPLGDVDLARTAGPGRWPLWAIIGHLACQRVFWLCDFAGEAGADQTPFTNAAWNCPGDDDLENALTGPQLAQALEQTFAIIDRILDNWTWDSLSEEIERFDRCHARGFVLQRALAHDAWHAAEANEVLSQAGLPLIEPW